VIRTKTSFVGASSKADCNMGNPKGSQDTGRPTKYLLCYTLTIERREYYVKKNRFQNVEVSSIEYQHGNNTVSESINGALMITDLNCAYLERILSCCVQEETLRLTGIGILWISC
jgi:hypothetical protein